MVTRLSKADGKVNEVKSIVLIFLIGAFAHSQPRSSEVVANAAKSEASAPKPVGVANELSGRGPRAIFLIKRARIDSAIGEPVLYPFERQTKNLFYDLPSGVITNE